MTRRPWTPDHKENGTTTIVVKKRCGECGWLLGDVSDEEIMALVDGLPTPKSEDECPVCRRHADAVLRSRLAASLWRERKLKRRVEELEEAGDALDTAFPTNDDLERWQEVRGQ